MVVNDIIEIVNEEIFQNKRNFKITQIGNVPICLLDDDKTYELKCMGLWIDKDGKTIILTKKSKSL